VEIDNDDVYIVATEEELKDGVRPIVSVPEPKSAAETCVIVGGGAAGFTTAEALRQSHYAGKIVMYTTEPNLPLDRTKLSKALIGDAAKLELLTQDELSKLQVEVRHAKVVSVDKKQKSVRLDNGQDASYDKLVLAVGAFPSKLPITGADLDGIFVLRNIEHVKSINEALGDDKSKHVVLLGGSFIGATRLVCIGQADA
jgi:NAD(P)H-nitrite reductase large subunit